VFAGTIFGPNNLLQNLFYLYGSDKPVTLLYPKSEQAEIFREIGKEVLNA
jgi:hypothetical protein